MMGNLMICDLTEGEKLAFLACLFMSGDMSSNEYVRQAEMLFCGGGSFDDMIERETDWDCLNRMMGNRMQEKMIS
jgi:hypothetical protein